ncbi:disintegrin and metalloproteinase domain-containing protein 10 isoform X12 [Cephus cinctus]|nr:disintegrin and metalloproteinase domain-containing protein 10 isoform X12 [Cephus cinctus]
MRMKMFRVLLACVWLVAGSPLHPLPLMPYKEITQGSYLRQYSVALYDTALLREHRARTRRDVTDSSDSSDSSDGPKSRTRKGPTLDLNVHAFDRLFKMRLAQDNSLFPDDAIFEGTGGRVLEFDTSHVYTGTLHDNERALVYGVVTEDGLFDGTVITGAEEIYIEPATRYLGTGTQYQGTPCHTIAYRSGDVATPLQHSLSLNQPPLENFSLNSLNLTVTINQPQREYQYRSWQPLYQNIKDGGSDAKPGFYPKDARKKDPTASSHNLELLDRLYRERYSRVLSKRTSIDPKKTTCMLYLQADHTFYEHYRSEEACIEVMTRHVQQINSIYRYTDFNQDGESDNISFMIKRIKVHGEGALADPTYRFAGNHGVEEFLELFSEEDYDAFCLSYMFTYRDFEKGTLGLAWTGDLKNAGGVCEKNGVSFKDFGRRGRGGAFRCGQPRVESEKQPSTFLTISQTRKPSPYVHVTALQGQHEILEHGNNHPAQLREARATGSLPRHAGARDRPQLWIS